MKADWKSSAQYFEDCGRSSFHPRVHHTDSGTQDKADRSKLFHTTVHTCTDPPLTLPQVSAPLRCTSREAPFRRRNVRSTRTAQKGTATLSNIRAQQVCEYEVSPQNFPVTFSTSGKVKKRTANQKSFVAQSSTVSLPVCIFCKSPSCFAQKICFPTFCTGGVPWDSENGKITLTSAWWTQPGGAVHIKT